jgi:hypothetical protein
MCHGKGWSWLHSSPHVDSKHGRECEQSNTDGSQSYGLVAMIGEKFLHRFLFPLIRNPLWVEILGV